MTSGCPKCGKAINEAARFCKHCGGSIALAQEKPLPPAASPPNPPVQARPAASAAPRAGPPVFYKDPAIATVLSFLFMGAGQIYNGQIGKGIAFLIMYALSLLLMFVIIGFITTPILWIWGMIDANGSAKGINERLAREQGQYQ